MRTGGASYFPLCLPVVETGEEDEPDFTAETLGPEEGSIVGAASPAMVPLGMVRKVALLKLRSR